MTIRWKGPNGIVHGKVVKTHVQYLVKTDNGKYVVVDEDSVIESADNKQHAE